MRGKLVAALAIASIWNTYVAAQGTGPSVHIEAVQGNVSVINGAGDRIGASAGSNGVLLVDVGNLGSSDAVRAAVTSLGRGEPKIILITHVHHAYADVAFPHARMVAHENVARRLGRPRYMFSQTLAPVPPGALPDTLFQDNHRFFFNGETIDIVHLPRGHTDGDAIVIFRESKVVMTGDAFVPHLSWIDYASGGSLEGYLAALDRMVEIVPKDAILVPGHGPLSRYEDLLALRDAVRQGVEWVRAGFARGQTLAQLQRQGLPESLRKWTSGGVPPSLFIESVYKGLNRAPRAGQACEFVNGLWFDGETFARQAGFYAVDGVLTRTRPQTVECAIDLGDRFVLPPLADAHTHDLGQAPKFPAASAGWLRKGAFYAMVQDPVHAVGPELRASSAAASTVDAVYTQGVITSSWNFIADLYANLASHGAFGEGVRIEDVEGERYFAIDTIADLERKWPKIRAANDRFVKVIMAFSAEFAKRKNNPEYKGTSKPGIDPVLLPPLVRRAHADGLKVSVHIETAEDFRRAVAAGADYIAHLPGWQVGPQAGYPAGDLSPWLLNDADARTAAASGVSIVTTVDKTTSDPRIHRHNLRLLKEAGARLLIGSDGFEGTNILGEIAALERTGVFSRAELLRMAVTETAAGIFPGRKIGIFRDGFEASFLAYEIDPLENLDVLKAPVLRVKQGAVLR